MVMEKTEPNSIPFRKRKKNVIIQPSPIRAGEG